MKRERRSDLPSLNQRFNNFINRATNKFNGKFDYSKVNYINAKTTIKIACPIHGEFNQVPDKHLAKSSHGCPKCSQILKKKPQHKKKDIVGIAGFLLLANEKYNNKYKYDLSSYEGLSKGRINIKCPIHGTFNTKTSSHLQKTNLTGCPKCGNEHKIAAKTETYEVAIKKCETKHKNKYIYPTGNSISYINKKSKIAIVCPKHGTFFKTITKHFWGQGCFECKIEELVNNNILVGGYSEDIFTKNEKLAKTIGKLYYLSIDNGALFKIGITIGKTENRIKSIKSKAKYCGYNISIKVLCEIEMPLYEAFKTEQNILNEYRYCRTYRKWSTELFTENILENAKFNKI